MEIILIITAAIVSIVAVVFFLKYREMHSLYFQARGRVDQLSAELNEEMVNSAVLGERVAAAVQRQNDVETERALLVDMFNQERQQMSEQFSARFNVLANEILEHKSRTMTVQNSDALNALLLPFGQKIDQFRERIEQESKQRFALENEVRRLAELNLKMSQEANNLTSALRGNSKVQGDWGEMILETLLESSGLKRDIHFHVQQSIKGDDGQILRPDVILTLPDEKQVIIDSKVSLTAYIAYTEAQTEAAAKTALASHVVSVKSHIAELNRKSYQKLVASPDFVIMFVPNEPAFLLALQADSTLWHEAYSKGVIMSSPTNLFAILRIVDDLWRRDSQSKNALEIARQGGDLYDKFVGFAETLGELGKAIKRSDELYDKSMNQLSTGNGNLVRRAERLRDMGVKTSKEIPSRLKALQEE